MSATTENPVDLAIAGRLLQGIGQSKEGFAICDSTGCFTYMNAEHLRMFGFTHLDEILRQPWTILYREVERVEIETRVFPQMARLGSWSGNIMAKRRDGTLFHEELTLSNLPDGGIACNCRDRTAEVELSRKLGMSEQLFREFSENLPQGVVIRDTAGICSHINRLGLTLHGGVLRQALGRRLEDVLPEELRLVFCGHDSQVIDSHVPARFEAECNLMEGKCTLEFTVFPVLANSGGIYAMGTTWSDVTVRSRHQLEIAATLERQRELLRLRSEFISLVSHEFRTPLSVIQTSHFLLRKSLGENAGPKMSRYLELQNQSLEALRDLVNQVLELNRAESESSGAALKPERPAVILAEIIERLNEAADTPRIRSHIDLADGFELAVDEKLFRAAVENLVTNGLKYSPTSTDVLVEAGYRNNELVITITDHGCGIPVAEQGRLFTSFFRGSNVGQVPGTGLGLAIVRRAMEFHGGRVEFESHEGRGTVFRIYFPLAGPAAPPNAAQHDQEAFA